MVFSKLNNNIRVIYGKIGELIKNSEFVITKGSTAISFAVLFNKPIIYYTTDEYENFAGTKIIIKSYSSYFNKSPINIDKNYMNINFEEEFIIDQKLYENYKNLFIKSPGSIDKISWEILKEKLLLLFATLLYLKARVVILNYPGNVLGVLINLSVIKKLIMVTDYEPFNMLKEISILLTLKNYLM